MSAGGWRRHEAIINIPIMDFASMTITKYKGRWMRMLAFVAYFAKNYF